VSGMGLPHADRAQRFLSRLADPSRSTIAEPVAIILAHPDDETIALGGQLDRFENASLVIVTDGAPHSLDDAERHGFASPQAYAAAREAELTAALAAGGLLTPPLLLGLQDQQVVSRLDGLVALLTPILAGTDIILTHAFEGGHPDHDGVALAVHRAAAALGCQAPGIVEMPLYRAGPGGTWAMQSFADDVGKEIAIRLDPPILARKRRMLAAHASQAEVLALFDPEVERFRPAPDHDFRRLPNGGDLLYERLGWLSRDAWLAAVAGEYRRCA